MGKATGYIELMRRYLDAGASPTTERVLRAVPRVLFNWGEPASADACARDVLLSACTVSAPADLRGPLLCPGGADECVSRVRALFPDFPDGPEGFLRYRRGAEIGDWRAALNQHWVICVQMDACLADRGAVLAVVRASVACILHATHGIDAVSDPDALAERVDAVLDPDRHTCAFLSQVDLAELAASVWRASS